MYVCVYMCIDVYFLVKYSSEIGGNKDFKLTDRPTDRHSSQYCEVSKKLHTKKLEAVDEHQA